MAAFPRRRMKLVIALSLRIMENGSTLRVKDLLAYYPEMRATIARRLRISSDTAQVMVATSIDISV